MKPFQIHTKNIIILFVIKINSVSMTGVKKFNYSRGSSVMCKKFL